MELIVPEQNFIRENIRGYVDEFFQTHELFPPVAYDRLLDISFTILVSQQWDEKYLAYTMVCCGNAIWRKVIGTIPYNRRVLILPQCLRNSRLCMADHDEFGLFCHDCGNCTIPEIINEAELLGYIVLVTEGTTITSKLIESGTIDGVIGIGCMESLQKIFVSINKYTIPGIGIPLLTCGCNDTIADLDWIRREMHYIFKDPSIRLLNLKEMKNKTTALFNETKVSRLMGTQKNHVQKIAREYILSGGQRIRPLLTVLTYESIQPHPDPDISDLLALCVECFHKASLIHDDIEDNDQVRNGKETLHTRYDIPIAINTGDYLIGEGYRLIAESGLSPDTIRESVKIISRGHKNLTIGQGNELIAVKNKEILSLSEILDVFVNKTAAAFNVSLLLGAIVGGANEELLNSLDKFSIAVGIAYQLNDDLTDFGGNNGDIANRKLSVLLSMLADKLPQEEKCKLQKACELNDNSTVLEYIERYRIKKETEDLMMTYIQKATSSLESIPNPGLKIALHEVLGKMFKLVY
jgi:geranylgeranyl pyrophosphate synthase